MDWRPHRELAKATAAGLGFLGAASLVATVVRLAALAVLARKLSAADFGIVTLSIVVVRFAQENAAFGLETTVIQKKELSEADINSVFWGSLAFAGVLLAALAACSPLVAWGMGVPAMASVIQTLSVVIFATCLGMVPRSLLERQMAYGKVALFEALGQMTGDVMAVTLALLGFGFWALIWGFIAGDFGKSAGYWLAAGWRPRLHGARLGNLRAWRFGSFVTTDRMLTFLSLNIDRLIIGRMLGASAAGFYALAYELVAFPAKRFSALVGRVLFPALSHGQEQAAASASFYLKAVRYVAIVTVPALVGLAVVAPDVSALIYGSKSTVIAPLLRLLVPAGIVFAVSTPAGSLLYSRGRPDVSAKWSAATVMVLGVCVSIGSLGGLNWAAAAVGITWVALFPVLQAIIAHVAQLSLSRPYAALTSGMLASCWVGGVAILTRLAGSAVIPTSNLLSLATQVAAGTLAFIMFIWITERQVFLPLLTGWRQRVNGAW